MSDVLPEVDQPREEGWWNEARLMHDLPILERPEARPPDASDPDQVKAARRDQRVAARELGVTIHEMMGLREVRAVIYRWLDRMGAFRAHDFPFGMPMDALQLARNAAQREQVQMITADLLAAAPEQYLLMLKEAQSDE